MAQPLDPATSHAVRHAVWLGANNPIELLTYAAQWLASRDGAVDVEALTWVRVYATPPPDPSLGAMYELGIYYEPVDPDGYSQV